MKTQGELNGAKKAPDASSNQREKVYSVLTWICLLIFYSFILLNNGN